MLHVAYEAVDLGPERVAAIDEDRGSIQVRVSQRSPLDVVVRCLNTEIERFMAASHWFQLWRDEIISRATPDISLQVVYLLDRRQPGGVEIHERKGLVSVHIDPALTVAEFAAAMNPATEKFLDGGCWFQLYAGEIIDNSPETMSQV